MAIDFAGILMDFLGEYGLIAIFILLVLDGAMLMPVLPGEAVMIIAVTEYVNNLPDLAQMVALATAAAVVGSLILYSIARFGGRQLIENHPRLFMMDRRRRESLEESFERPTGQSLVMFLRVIPLTRIIVNIPAGLARMKLGRFLILSTIGMLVFHAGFMYTAFKFNQPGSGLSAKATELQQAYGTPAWEYLQAHELVGILAAIAIGAWLSYRSSKRMLEYPVGTVHSILGWLTVRILLVGAPAIAGLLYYDPQLVYQGALWGGVDLLHIASELAVEPVRTLWYVCGGVWLVGLVLFVLETKARRKQEKAERAEEREKARREAEKQWAPYRPDRARDGRSAGPRPASDRPDHGGQGSAPASEE